MSATRYPLTGERLIFTLNNRTMLLRPFTVDQHGQFGPLAYLTLYGKPGPHMHITHNVYKLGWATTLLNTCSSKITTKPHQLDSYRKPINNGKPNLPIKESTTVPRGSPALIMPNSQANGPNKSLDSTSLMP